MAVMRPIAALAAVSLLLAGCGNGGDEDDAVGVGGEAQEATEQEDAAAEQEEGVEGEEGTTVQLSGDVEVPEPGDEEGSGNADLVFAEGEVCVEATVVLDQEPMAMHIHEGERGEAGPVVVDFGEKTRDDGWSTCVDADQALLDEIAAEPTGYYLNVHNEPFPDGAVRGQLG